MKECYKFSSDFGVGSVWDYKPIATQRNPKKALNFSWFLIVQIWQTRCTVGIFYHTYSWATWDYRVVHSIGSECSNR